jgi:hypothetical protein
MPWLTVPSSRRREFGRSIRAAWVISLLATVAPASAAGPSEPRPPRTSSLSWVRLPGAERCVSTQDLARDVEQRLGHPIFVSPSEADVSVEGHIEPNAGTPGAGWHAVLVLRDAHGVALGTRDLRRDDVSCDAMRAPLALVVVIMIDPDAALAGHGSPPSPSPPPPVVIERPVPVIVRVPDAAPPRPPPWHLDAGGSLIGGLGLLPGPAIGVFGGGILVPPRLFFGVEVYGAAWLDQTLAAGGANGGNATFWFGYVGGGLCPLVLRGRRTDLFGCASGQLGYLASYGPSPTPNQTQVHVAGALEMRGTLHIGGPITARAGAMLVVPLIRDQFVYDEANGGSGRLFQMAPVAGTLDLGLGVAFP